MEQRLTVVERAMKRPSSQEEEGRPAKTKKLATSPVRRRDLGDTRYFYDVGQVVSKSSAQE